MLHDIAAIDRPFFADPETMALGCLGIEPPALCPERFQPDKQAKSSEISL